MIDTYNTASMAAVAACRAIAARFSRQADKWVGDLKILASQKARAFLTLADTLEARGAAALGGSMGAPMAGGISIADKEAVAGNPDRVPPSFYRGIHDNEVGET